MLYTNNKIFRFECLYLLSRDTIYAIMLKNLKNSEIQIIFCSFFLSLSLSPPPSLWEI